MKSFKEQCIALRKKDKSIIEIMAITGRSKSSIHFHIKDIPLSQKKRKQISEDTRRRAIELSGARKGKSIRAFKTFNEWSPNTVLLVSHLIFDGEISSASCGYNNRSQALIERVKKLFSELYEFEPKHQYKADSGVHRIHYHNVALAAYFKDKNEDLLLNILDLSKDCQKEFLRAFFDDEGCIDFRPKRNKRSVRGYQKDRSILIIVQRLLRNFDIEAIIREPNEVVITKKENLIKFQEEINFSKGVTLNPNRSNSIWKKPIEKRELLDQAIKSFKT